MTDKGKRARDQWGHDRQGYDRQGHNAAGQDALSLVAVIADRARERNLNRAGELEVWANIGERGGISAKQRGEAAEIAHQLAGSAGTFGYLGATDVAREVEQLFAEANGPEAWTRLTECVRDLLRHLHEPPELSAG